MCVSLSLSDPSAPDSGRNGIDSLVSCIFPFILDCAWFRESKEVLSGEKRREKVPLLSFWVFDSDSS